MLVLGFIGFVAAAVLAKSAVRWYFRREREPRNPPL